ncbi:MAG: bifunctional ornithine acetyltransferase/N-acetylglutamate synthase [Actinomycetia bacterium]|nr:bifunctional ornithine acetyltransferase/N-acetylglutamate synthase [Actinomycetes bacterium]
MTGDATSGGVTTSRGFRASGVAALVVNDGPELNAAAVLTRNRVRAAPVTWTQRVVADGLGCDVDEVAVCSTGLIAVRLPMDKLTSGVHSAVAHLGRAGGADATPRTATSRTFDRLDSDGCMLTNDTGIVMASGASGVMIGRDLDEESFVGLLTDVCRHLALQLLADAEGASKQIEITVTGAASEGEDVAVARSVARSNLFKCAIHGEDPNWGRVLAAASTTDAAFEPGALSVVMNGVPVAAKGAAVTESLVIDLSAARASVEIDLGAGSAQGSVWTNDLTTAYVHENSAHCT